MTLPSRAVTILGLIQAGLILGGWLIVRTLVRVYDDHMLEQGLSRFHMPVLAVFIQWWGLWFLLVPISWVSAIAFLENKEQSENRIDWSSAKVGGLITVALALFFAFGVLLALARLVNPLPMPTQQWE